MKRKIYYNKRIITLKEIDNSENNLFENLDIEEEYDEPFLHKCNKRMENILNIFFGNEKPKEISFEYYSFKKLYKDFKSHFKFVKAAGGIVTNAKGELLVIKRFGFPDLPKGKVKKGEKIKNAAIREVEEECGITNPIIEKKAKPSYHIYYKGGKRILKKTYWFYMKYLGDEKPVPEAKENITAALWLDKKTVNNLSEKTFKTLRVYFENF